MVIASDSIAEIKQGHRQGIIALINFAVIDLGISKYQLAKEIAIDRSNLYGVLNGRLTLTAFQYSLLMKSLENRGIDPKQCLERVLGECENLDLSQVSSQQLLQSLLSRRRR